MNLVSVCLVHAARSVIVAGEKRIELFPRCVDSLYRASRESGVACELVIGDWPKIPQESPLRSWLWKRTKLPARVVPFTGAFSKGRACNVLADESQGNVLLFLDCDMLVPGDVLNRGLDWIAKGKAYFPGYLALDVHGEAVRPKSPGAGNAMMTPEHFKMLRASSLKGWPENTTWGNFDRPVWNWFNSQGLAAEPLYEREIVPGFLHLWHPKGAGWSQK